MKAHAQTPRAARACLVLIGRAGKITRASDEGLHFEALGSFFRYD